MIIEFEPVLEKESALETSVGEGRHGDRGLLGEVCGVRVCLGLFGSDVGRNRVEVSEWDGERHSVVDEASCVHFHPRQNLAYFQEGVCVHSYEICRS